MQQTKPAKSKQIINLPRNTNVKFPDFILVQGGSGMPPPHKVFHQDNS